MTEIHSGQAYLDGRTDDRTDGRTYIHRTAIVATMSSSPQAHASQLFFTPKRVFQDSQEGDWGSQEGDFSRSVP